MSSVPLGGDLVVCLISALSTMAIDQVNRLLNRHGLPFSFQHAVGGAIATAPPMALYLLGPKVGLPFDPTIAIAAFRWWVPFRMRSLVPPLPQ